MMGSTLPQGIFFALLVGAVFGTPCSPENRANLADCLLRIKEKMYDQSLFWFGDSYATNCPNGPFSGIDCSNPSPGQGLSVATRVFPNGFNDSLLTDFISVKFTSDPGEYTGCGNTFRVNETVMFDIDPSSNQTVRPWYVRHTPEMTWNSTPGQYYSLYVYDIVNYITHAVYINIEGNVIPTIGANVIDAYHGPLATRNQESVYAFLLFKQNGYLDPAAAQEWYNVSHPLGTMASSSHIPDFMTLLNMTGPIAVNWMVAIGDEYAAGTMYSRGIVAMCPVFVGLALDMVPRPFLPNPVSLTVNMDIAFQVEALTYGACCRIYSEAARTLTLNPIGNELLQSSATRSGLVQTFTFEKLGLFFMARNFTGEMYSMIAFDPDVPSPTVGNGSHPLLHQMQTNIMDGNFTSGEEVIPWNGPYPPNDEPHYYYFLLYKHTDTVNATHMMSYAADCGTRLAGRCLYDINRAVTENNFTLVGANWFRAVRDPYVRYRNIQSNPNVTEAQCTGQPGYTVNCETSASNILLFNSVLITIASLFGIVYSAF